LLAIAGDFPLLDCFAPVTAGGGQILNITDAQQFV